MKKIWLFVTPVRSTFTEIDRSILLQSSEVKTFYFKNNKGASQFLSQFKLLFWLIRNLHSSVGVYIWFADYHAITPTLAAFLLNKKSVIIIGGYDAAKISQYQYGAFSTRIRGLVVKIVCFFASNLIVPTTVTSNHLFQNLKKDYSSKTKKISLCQDDCLFHPKGKIRERKVLCVSAATNLNRLKIKGLDFLVEVSAVMPETFFTIVGVTGHALEYLKSKCFKNVTFIPWVPNEKLVELYSSHKVICQFSRIESFGLVVLEGMLCECVPVTVKSIGTSEIIESNFGFTIDEYNVMEAKEALLKALDAPDNNGALARKHAIQFFSIEERTKKLQNLL